MGPHKPERHLRGVDNAVDQVARRIAFEAAHPEWRITSDKRLHWRAERDSYKPVVAYELRELLDELESRYRPRGENPYPEVLE